MKARIFQIPMAEDFFIPSTNIEIHDSEKVTVQTSGINQSNQNRSQGGKVEGFIKTRDSRRKNRGIRHSLRPLL